MAMKSSMTAMVVAGALAFLAASACQAQQGSAETGQEAGRAAPGMLTARSFSEPPAGAVLFVAPYDDSDLHLKLKSDFEGQLVERIGASLASEAAADFLFLFESEVMPADLAPRPPSLGSARLDDGGAEVNVNVWSSSKDSVLGGRQSTPAGGDNVFHINAVLRDKNSGSVVWQGDAYYVLKEPDPERVARALVGPLVAKVGQSVDREPFQID